MKTNETWTGYATCLRSPSEPLAWAGLDGRSSAFDPSVLSDKRTHTGSFASLPFPMPQNALPYPVASGVLCGMERYAGTVLSWWQSFPEVRKGGLFWAWLIKSAKGKGTAHLRKHRLTSPVGVQSGHGPPTTQKAASSLLWQLSANTSIPTLVIL